ncbi:MAG: alpha/beta fold hydrolase [Microgenomates group bacterium]
MPALIRAFFVFSCLLFFLIPKSVFSFFSEDFMGTSLDSNVWQEYSNSGQIIVGDGKMALLRSTIKSKSFPYVFTKSNIFPEFGPFSIEIRYRYLSAGNFGDGIIISSENVPANGIDPGSNIPAFITFVIWQDQPTGLSFQKFLCNVDGVECNELKLLKPLTRVPDFNTHDIRIDYSDRGQYLVYLDGDISPIYVSDFNQKRPKKMWFGNSLKTGTVDFWSSFEIDYIHIVPINSKYPTILIPGLGASWDVGAILTGNVGSNWQIPSFVSQYDGLINSFVNAGYTENTDLFVFPYDWRRPLDDLADRLNEYVSTNIPVGHKVNLVGHSMGGLVARAYAQKHGVNRINEIVTVGSPNKGATEAYGVWEGATIWNDVWWAKVALELTTHFGANVGESNVQTVQRLAPSLRDLLPIYDFLKKDGLVIPWSSLSQKNLYLSTLNQNVSQIDSLTTAIFSNDIQTNNIVNVVAPPEEDLALYRWIDGKPSNNPFEVVSGDGTVTEESARGIFSNILEGSGWHGELVTKTDNIQKIFGVLGLDQTKALSGVADDNREVFVAALRSPGKLDVCDSIEITKCNDQLGLYFPDDKLFILPGYNDEELVVKITEEGTKGQYKLHLGDIGDMAKWSVVGGDLNNTGQVDRYDVQVDGTGVTARLIDEVPPSIPTDGLPNGSYSSTNEFDFTWDASTDDRGGEVTYEFQSSMNPVQVEGILTTGLWQSGTLSNNTVHSTGAPDGTWYWQVRAKDTAGNFSAWSQVWTVTLDHLAPTSTFSLPPLLNVWSGKIMGTAIDNVSGVAKVDLIINDPLGVEDIVAADGTTNWSYTIASPIEGKYIIRSRATDVAGNVEGGIEGKQIIFDITAPTITIITPTAGTFQSWNLPGVSYSVVDNFDDNPDVNVSGWSTNEGIHTVSILAIDHAGNQSSKSVTYIIKNPPTNIEQCKRGGWELYRLFGFKNQGQCVSSIQRNEKASIKFFWWI